MHSIWAVTDFLKCLILWALFCKSSHGGWGYSQVTSPEGLMLNCRVEAKPPSCTPSTVYLGTVEVKPHGSAVLSCWAACLGWWGAGHSPSWVLVFPVLVVLGSMGWGLGGPMGRGLTGIVPHAQRSCLSGMCLWTPARKHRQTVFGNYCNGAFVGRGLGPPQQGG